MCSGQYDGAVKADIILDGGAQISQFGAGGADSAKDFARQTKPVDDFIVPILAYSAHQGSGGSIGVLVGHHAGQAVIQVIWQPGPRGGGGGGGPPSGGGGGGGG